MSIVLNGQLMVNMLMREVEEKTGSSIFREISSQLFTIEPWQMTL